MKRPAVDPAFHGVGDSMDLMAPKAARPLPVHPSFRVANAQEVGDIRSVRPSERPFYSGFVSSVSSFSGLGRLPRNSFGSESTSLVI